MRSNRPLTRNSKGVFGWWDEVEWDGMVQVGWDRLVWDGTVSLFGWLYEMIQGFVWLVV